MDRFSIAKGDPPPEPKPVEMKPGILGRSSLETYVSPGVYVNELLRTPFGTWETPDNSTVRRIIPPSFELSPPTDSLRGRRQALERESQARGNWDPLRPPAVDNGPNNDGAPSAQMERHRNFIAERWVHQMPDSFLISAAVGAAPGGVNFVRIYPREMNISTNSVGPSGDMSFTVSMEFQATREQLDALLGP